MKTDREIALEHGLLYKVSHQEHAAYNADVLAAMAAARAEQHAECVRLLRESKVPDHEYEFEQAGDWLEAQKP